VLRSPHAAARINKIDSTTALSLDGVKAIYTAADLNADGIAPMPCAAPVQNSDGSNMASPPHPALADGAVRQVGGPVAFVIAETAKAARDAAEQITVGVAGHAERAMPHSWRPEPGST
jgi:carbon-monoxide dehydrogenase large subunit